MAGKITDALIQPWLCPGDSEIGDNINPTISIPKEPFGSSYPTFLASGTLHLLPTV